MSLLSYLIYQGVQNLPIVALWCSVCHFLIQDMVTVNHAAAQPSNPNMTVFSTASENVACSRNVLALSHTNDLFLRKSSGISVQLEQKIKCVQINFLPMKSQNIYIYIQTDPLLSKGRCLILNQRSLKSFYVTVKSPDFALQEYSAVLLKCLMWQRIFVTNCNIFLYLRETFGQWYLWLRCVRFNRSMYCIL